MSFFIPPPQNMFGNYPMGGMFNTPTKKSPQGKNGQDNIDSVDMEMSDEEQECGGGGSVGGGGQMGKITLKKIIVTDW